MKGKREAAGGEGRRKAPLGREGEGGKDEHVQSNRKRFASIKHTRTAMGPVQLLLSQGYKLLSGWRQVSTGGCCVLVLMSHCRRVRDVSELELEPVPSQHCWGN